ncbi:MAG: hypothetical protein CSYNP_00150 [Syntrophus sp. SKADARSKE-3]|nr:hypothetical protein [Syntrophus sp. SKADARSKE-3]
MVGKTTIFIFCFALIIISGCSSGGTVGGGSGSPGAATPGGTGTGGATLNLPVLTPLPAVETTPPAGGISNATAASYVVLAWNDLGMHCLNPSYDTAVILPPYNTVWAQVIKRGNPPQVVTSGLTVSYRMINNTTSQKGAFTQFWTYAMQLFGVAPALDKGLNLVDPTVSNGLTGTMLAKGDHFQVNGIPVTPINDGNTWNPFQVTEITVKDSATGVQIARTRTTVPTSDEINCGKCHGNTSDPTAVFNDILVKHDSRNGTTLRQSKPVMCASCHGSPVLGASLKPGIKYLSEAIHGFHGNLTSQPNCYDCHPGSVTQCSRSTRHTTTNGNCVSCHGTLANVAATVTNGSRIPWTSEPKCVACHNAGINGTGVAGVDTSAALYRDAAGHGGVYCAGCHGSPHAMIPAGQPSDNYQSLQYQGAAKTIGDCGSCHRTSRGGGNNFTEEHATGRASACNVCHTGFQNAASTAAWPYQFQWKSR